MKWNHWLFGLEGVAGSGIISEEEWIRYYTNNTIKWSVYSRMYSQYLLSPLAEIQEAKNKLAKNGEDTW